MKLHDILSYVKDRGARFVPQDGRLILQNHTKLTERCRTVLFNRRAEIYDHFNLPMPDKEFGLIEQCPHCGKKLVGTDANEETTGGEF